MSNEYKVIKWDRIKKIYDLFLMVFVGLYSVGFIVLHLIFHPGITAETLIIRLTGTLAFTLLSLVLVIGPLCRFDKRFLPLLYNRRHLGVTTFTIAMIHGGINIFQFHALGSMDPIRSIFAANTEYFSFYRFPFEVLGFVALVILMVMAFTSHDFWLKNLTPKGWKRTHLLVFPAYVLLVFHVLLGYFNENRSLGFESLDGYRILFGFEVIGVFVVQVAARLKDKKSAITGKRESGDWVEVDRVQNIRENEAVIIRVKKHEIAVFKYNKQISAVSNRCSHQRGPLGEGKIIDNCITCPWHGYQYYPYNGQSPPPFTEKIQTFQVKIEGDTVFVRPVPLAPGSYTEPAIYAI